MIDRKLTRRDLLKYSGLALGAAALASCAPKPTPTVAPKAVATTAPAVPATKAPAAPETIRFMARGDDAIFKVFRDIKAGFEATQPGVIVELEETPQDYYQKFQLQIASGTPPDSLFEAVGTVGTSARKKLIVPIDDMLAKEPGYKQDDFHWSTFACMRFDGKLYGLPYDGGPYPVFWDKVLFQEAGLKPLSPTERVTWDEITEMARKITTDMDGRHPGDSGFDARRIKQYGISPRVDRFYIYVYCFGGEVLDANGNLTLEMPETIAAIQWLADLGAKHFVAPSPAFEQSTPVNFLSSNMGMQITGSFDIVRQRQRKNDWDIAPLAKGKLAVPSVLYSPLSLVAGSKKLDAAWKWLWYCCSEPGQTAVANLGQTVPAIKKVAEKMAADTSTKPEHKSVFLGEFEGVRLPGDKWGSLFGSYWTEWFQIWNPVFDPVWRGVKTAADAVKEVTPKLDKLLKTGEVS